MAARSSSANTRDNALTTDAAFGVVLRLVRLEKGLTQEQLAWKTGIERAFISELERGVKGASINTLFRLALGLQISPGTLILEAEKKLRETASAPTP